MKLSVFAITSPMGFGSNCENFSGFPPLNLHELRVRRRRKLKIESEHSSQSFSEAHRESIYPARMDSVPISGGRMQNDLSNNFLKFTPRRVSVCGSGVSS